MAVELTEGNFKKEVLEDRGLVLVDFWAAWCGPCRMMSPIVEAIARDYAGRLKVGKIDVDENQSLAEEYRIRSIPTLMLFKDGKPVDHIVGAVPRQALEEKLARWLA